MPVSLPACIVASCTLTLALHAQTLVRSVNGPAAGIQYGKACITVPDQNGDGFKDLLVGAPGFNQARGAIYCVSGAFLSTGSGVQTLWSITSPSSTSPGDMFGYAVAAVGDLNGDGVSDFVVGQPGHDDSWFGTLDNGVLRWIDGATHALSGWIYGENSVHGLGKSIMPGGHVSGTPIPEVLVGAPASGTGSTFAFVLRGSAINIIGSVTTFPYAQFQTTTFGDDMGASLAGNRDLDGDGLMDVVFGSPGYDNGPATNAGRISVALSTASTLIHCASTIPGERFGQSLSMAHDYDGDGIADILVGAPNSPNGSAFEVGRVVVLSGARLAAQTPPYEIYTFTYGAVTPPVNHTDPAPNMHFGAAVHACDDLNGDGVGEILIGAPGHFTPGLFTGWSFRGLVRIYSGANGALLTSVVGGSTDRIGDALAGSVGDLNGDGFPEFVVAGSLSDAGGTDSGVVKCYRLFPLQPSTYCVGKVNSQGCTPFLSFSGLPSATSGQPFAINASNFLNQKSGLLFYSHSPAAVPFQGGTKCVASPSARTAAQSSGGATSGSSCSGTYSFDFNLRIASGVDASLTAGADVCAQYWSRDPASPSTTSLSNAVQFVINP